jgi:hypothetical protein
VEEGESRHHYTPEVVEGTGASGSYDPSAGNYWSDAHRTCVYTYASLSTRYLTNQCRVQLPMAAQIGGDSGDNPPTCQCFQVGQPQGRRVIELDFERAGTWPDVIPPLDSYTDGGLQGLLLRHWIEPHPPSLAADGVTAIYRITAYYVYALNRPPTLEEGFRVGVAPQTRFAKDDDQAKFNPKAYNIFLGP